MSERHWWELVEEHLTRGEHDDLTVAAADDDPWADDGVAPTLTDAQRALLGGLDDQPGVPRVTHARGEHEDQPPVPRFAHHPTDHDVPGPTTGNIPGETP